MTDVRQMTVQMTNSIRIIDSTSLGRGVFISDTVVNIMSKYFVTLDREPTRVERSIIKRYLTYLEKTSSYFSFINCTYDNGRESVIVDRAKHFFEPWEDAPTTLKQYRAIINKLNVFLMENNIHRIDRGVEIKPFKPEQIYFQSKDKETTTKTYITASNNFRKFLKDNGRTDLYTEKNFQDWKQYLRKNHKPHTVNTYLSAIKSLAKHLAIRPEQFNLNNEEMERIASNQLERITSIKGLKLSKDEFYKGSYSKDELIQLVNAGANKKERLLLGLMSFLGLRVSEALSLRYSNINKDAYTVIGKGEMTPTTTKFMPSKVYDLFVQVAQDHQAPDTFIFEYSYNDANDVLTRAIERAGLPAETEGKKITLHSLRHSFCQIMVENYSFEIAQKLCRHKNTETTMMYYRRKQNLIDFNSLKDAF